MLGGVDTSLVASISNARQKELFGELTAHLAYEALEPIKDKSFGLVWSAGALGERFVLDSGVSTVRAHVWHHKSKALTQLLDAGKPLNASR